ncbi:hypothetical protein SARC_08483 [Sphaeroforma arctica JP610]|uniref:Protein kinase domain-containing protein n=1 Tax=Sphaeroforma arctica JP610 TaxID=667725 RepID=A0A0L0FRE8_9EUKA|nr:hypothetical protein SARC_08483 [Sphaeroforma arctica JP610]KNC79116.1 hypothetical protein SARC_08483 [Sphaeroforma arctica JP610]|eukprot:XP_014153018.1 hypothetical protein SARC_08483 [Sphaeroforma arctica JP610]
MDNICVRSAVSLSAATATTATTRADYGGQSDKGDVVATLIDLETYMKVDDIDLSNLVGTPLYFHPLVVTNKEQSKVPYDGEVNAYDVDVWAFAVLVLAILITSMRGD